MEDKKAAGRAYRAKQRNKQRFDKPSHARSKEKVVEPTQPDSSDDEEADSDQRRYAKRGLRDQNKDVDLEFLDVSDVAGAGDQYGQSVPTLWDVVGEQKRTQERQGEDLVPDQNTVSTYREHFRALDPSTLADCLLTIPFPELVDMDESDFNGLETHLSRSQQPLETWRESVRSMYLPIRETKGDAVSLPVSTGQSPAQQHRKEEPALTQKTEKGPALAEKKMESAQSADKGVEGASNVDDVNDEENLEEWLDSVL
eukprot:Clim_evm17s12 gene=Clim_evmTU17s12